MQYTPATNSVLCSSFSPLQRRLTSLETPAWRRRGNGDPATNSNNTTEAASTSSTSPTRGRPRYDLTGKYRPVDGQAPVILSVRNGDIGRDWRKPVETPVTIVPDTKDHSTKSTSSPKQFNAPATQEHQPKTSTSPTDSIVPAEQKQQIDNATSSANIPRIEEQSRHSTFEKSIKEDKVSDPNCTTNSQNNDDKPAEARRRRRRGRGGRRHHAKKASTTITKEPPPLRISVNGKMIVCKWADPSEPKYSGSNIVPPHPSTLPIPSFFKPRPAPKEIDNSSDASNGSTSTTSDNETDSTSVSNAADDESTSFISDNEEKYAASVEDNATDSSSVTNPYDSDNESTWSASNNGLVSLWLENERANLSLVTNPVKDKSTSLTWNNSTSGKDHSASFTSNNTIDSSSISRIGCPIENENVIRAIQIDNKPVRMRILEEMEGEKRGYWIVRNFPWIRDNPRYSPREAWEMILNNLLWAKYYPDQYEMYQQALYIKYQQTLLESVD